MKVRMIRNRNHAAIATVAFVIRAWSFHRHSTFGFRHSLHMPYKYLEDVGTADIAFEATGRDLPQLFTAAADATLNVMIDNIDSVEPRETRRIELKNDKIDMLLFDFL